MKKTALQLRQTGTSIETAYVCLLEITKNMEPKQRKRLLDKFLKNIREYT